LWSRQTTQNALRRRRDARRTIKGLEKLGFARKVKIDRYVLIVVKKPSIDCSFYIYRLGKVIPLPNRVTKRL